MDNRIIIILAAALPLPAHAGAATGGATEPTQLANHIELVMQVSEAVETTSNTLQTAYATMQQLRNFPQAVLDDAINGLPVEKVRAMADAYVVMSEAVGVYRDAENVLRKAQQDAENLKILPSELLRHKANAAAQYGGIYQQTYEAEMARIKRAADMSKEVQKQANIVKSIDSTVGGIQALATQNVAMQTTMAELATSIQTANANAARESALRQQERERVLRRLSDVLDARRRAEIEAPPVTRLPMPHEFAAPKQGH